MPDEETICLINRNYDAHDVVAFKKGSCVVQNIKARIGDKDLQYILVCSFSNMSRFGFR